MPHLDLLHPARRLLGHRLENNRLITMEKEILGVHRQGDIPGSEIPQRYFDWLRKRDARLLTDVFEHNRLDIISMATLSVHLAEMLNYHRDISSCEHEDLLASAKLLLVRGDASGARKILELIIESKGLHIALEARKTLSLIYKRSGRWNDALRIWEMMLRDDPGNFFATEEMAKCFEHRKHDLPKAINIVTHALNLSSFKSISEKNALEHRITRLKSRIVTTGSE
jgi:tetratricopeptide (TPR) repeat protein